METEFMKWVYSSIEFNYIKYYNLYVIVNLFNKVCMSFLITKIFYPIKKKIILNNNVSLCNPSAYEKKIIKEYVKFHIENNKKNYFEKLAGINTSLSYYKNADKDNVSLEEVIKNIKKTKHIKSKDFLDYICNNIVVLRDSNSKKDQSEFKLFQNSSNFTLKQYLKKLTTVYLPAGDYDNITKLSLFLSCIYSDYPHKMHIDLTDYDDFIELFYHYGKGFKNIETENPSYSSKLFEKMIVSNPNFYRVIKNHKEIVEIVGSLLSVSHDSHSEYTTILLYTSIIELILIMKPDVNKHNLEDSIRKQFALKCALVEHNNDSSNNLSKDHSFWKDVYDQRSNIAHGNLKQFKKIDIENLYVFIPVLLKQWVNSDDFITFLKNS
jgi:hypothetical protein